MSKWFWLADSREGRAKDVPYQFIDSPEKLPVFGCPGVIVNEGFL